MRFADFEKEDNLAAASRWAIDEKLSLVMESDASENAISAGNLNHQNLLVAFFFQMLTKNGHCHASAEKEALANVESDRKWVKFHAKRHFKIYNGYKVNSFHVWCQK